MLEQNLLIPPPSTSLPDQSLTLSLGGKSRESICAGLHGKYFTQCYRGNVFIRSFTGATFNGQGSTPSAIIYNFAGSGRSLVPIKLQFGLQTVAVVTANITLAGFWFPVSNTYSIGTQFATTGGNLPTPGSIFRGGANAYLGNPNSSVAVWLTGAGSGNDGLYIKTIGATINCASSPGPANNYWQLTEYFDGEMILSPGTALVFQGNIGAIGTWEFTLVWEEVPI